MSDVANRSDRLPLVGGMATMPSRATSLPRALASVLPQVDRLYLFLDQYDKVPAWLAEHPKIVPLLALDHGRLGSNGKFLGACIHPMACRYFCFDDDILYPDRYVQVLSEALVRRDDRAVVGFHGALFKAPYSSYMRDRTVIHFSQGLDCDMSVDVIGTGTAAFHTGTFSIDSRKWHESNMDDLFFAIEAANRGLPRVLVSRPPGFLVAIEEGQKDSLWHKLKRDDSRQTTRMRAAMKELPGAWQCSSESRKRLFGCQAADPLDREPPKGCGFMRAIRGLCSMLARPSGSC
ncbi:hypothetical protein [Holophaga foetida]|uniref:hypothetical protein n=1 Tax=Holophaga foetida TaxID=35839 RepID=UPI000247378D|nr:hypothetical protein [Holophaga foetida]